MSPAVRLGWMDRDSGVPLVRQCGLAEVARATWYARQQPGTASLDDLDLMRRLDEAADVVSAYYPHRPRPGDYSGLMKNLRRRADGRLHWHWDPKFVTQFRRAEPPQFRAEMLVAARQIHIPTLLVRGLLSDIVSDDGVAKLRAALPTLEVFGVADAAHMVAGDKNDKFNRAVLAFLRRQMPATHE